MRSGNNDKGNLFEALRSTTSRQFRPGMTSGTRCAQHQPSSRAEWQRKKALAAHLSRPARASPQSVTRPSATSRSTRSPSIGNALRHSRLLTMPLPSSSHAAKTSRTRVQLVATSWRSAPTLPPSSMWWSDPFGEILFRLFVGCCVSAPRRARPPANKAAPLQSSLATRAHTATARARCRTRRTGSSAFVSRSARRRRRPPRAQRLPCLSPGRGPSGPPRGALDGCRCT